MQNNLIDHGENDPVAFDFDPATAKFTATVLQIHRTSLNDRDKARRMRENEIALERELEKLL